MRCRMTKMVNAMKKDPFKLTKADLKNETLITFLQRAREIHDQNAFRGAFNPFNGVLYD